LSVDFIENSLPFYKAGNIPLLLPILILTIINFAGASLGRLMAIPPGNVTPLWPPSGIALAALLLFGYRLWPGVWLGSFAFNLLFFYLPDQHIPGLSTLLCCVGIATGSTLQALAGTYCARRWGNYNPREWNPKAFFKMLFLAGPFCCLIATTIGSISLSLNGFLAERDILNTWVTWWFGDTAGVMAFGGLTLSSAQHFTGRNRLTMRNRKAYLWHVCALLAIVLGRHLVGLANAARAHGSRRPCAF
jgi:integral membrane sensor domain MASE1